MKFAAAISSTNDAEDAVHDLIAQLHPQSSEYDFATVFFTSHFSGDADSIAQTLMDEFAVSCLIGCSCEGVIGGKREIERGPGLSVLVGRVPGARCEAFHLSQGQWSNALADKESLEDHLSVDQETRALITMCDPWTTPLIPVLDKFNTNFRGVPMLGGVASGAQKARQNVLLFNDTRFDEGMVGISIRGAVRVESVVSQGCRPIGRAMVITKGQGNVIEELGGRPALEVLEETIQLLSDEDKLLLSSGLLIGRAMNEYKPRFGRGDFVVRNLLGINDVQRAIGVGDRIRVGQTVQFHLRDASTAHEDLKLLLTTRKTPKPHGALLFSCNGRGTRLFDTPHHDASIAAELMGEVPLAGFFAAGEIGPVGGQNFIHAHTASFALFSPEN
jgi:small ligand-binding sensory domain FIST